LAQAGSLSRRVLVVIRVQLSAIMACSFVPMVMAAWVGAAFADVLAAGTAAAADVVGNAAAQPPQEHTPGLRLTRMTNTTVEERRLKPWEDSAKIVVKCNDGTSTIRDCGEGTCVPAVNTCLCKDDWYTTEANKPCKTKKKSRTTAILLHVFVGNFGAGAFYLGWTAYGVATLLMCLVPCVCICVLVCGGIASGDEKGGLAALAPVIQCCFGIASMGLWIAVIVYIADGESRDSDNVPLS